MQGIREIFLSNHVLATLAKHYGFQNRILISPKESMQGLLDNETVLADAFEAYVGALDVEAKRARQPARLMDWYTRLFSLRVFPTLRDVGVAKEEHLIQKWVGRKAKKAKKKEQREPQPVVTEMQAQQKKRDAQTMMATPTTKEEKGDSMLPRPESSKRHCGPGLAPVSHLCSCCILLTDPSHPQRKKGTSNLPEEVIAADGNPAHASSSTNKPRPTVLK